MRATRNRIARLETAAARSMPLPRLVVIREVDGSLWDGPEWEDRRRLQPSDLTGFDVLFVEFRPMEDANAHA